MTADSLLDGDQLIASRRLDAPPALVWEMFTRPEHVAAFWGGEHAEVAPDSVLIDLRVGGTFELTTLGLPATPTPCASAMRSSSRPPAWCWPNPAPA